MGNALFVVWRESAEAMLVVGVLYAWLKNRADAATGMRYLWGGVAAGAGLAGVLALVMLGIASSLSGNGLDYFQLAIMLVASGLIVQMVFWMHRHGRTFKKDLESDMARNANPSRFWTRFNCARHASKSAGRTCTGIISASMPRRTNSAVIISGERTCSIGSPTMP